MIRHWFRQKDMVNVESSFKATEGFMANWKGSIKDGIHLHGPVSLNYSQDKD